MENYKICVYAIAKNEIKFVEEWVKNMSEADYIVVLDTGSTDGTFEKLKELGVITEQKIITPWRFDVARNESMKLIPADADIAVCTDLDELFEPGWANILRENWNDEAEKVKYLYTWNHDENGLPLTQIWYEKIHKNDNNWYWDMPVHEALTYKKHNIPSTIWLPETFHLHHYADETKSRGQYLGLMQLGINENPKHFLQNYYYGRELFYYNRYQEAIKQFKHLLTFNDEGYEHHKAAALMFMGLSYKVLKQYKEAEIAFLQAAILGKNIRDPMVELLKMSYEQQNWYKCVDVGERILKIDYVKGAWYENSRNYKEIPHDYLSIAYYNTGNFEKSYEHVKKALEYNSLDGRIISNKEIILTQLEGGN